ncbi:MAG: hypothetical protein LBU62_07440 [Bacteroidales bacterium]|jgi:hypothetical protein|nr:hypothetical protein [Bacteroidales bacterium]
MTLFLAVWLNVCSALFHPVYVSVCNVDIDASRSVVTLSLKVFTDDMETMLHNKYNINGWIGTPKEHRNSRRLIGEYIAERLSVEVNRRNRLVLQTDSMIVSEGALWIYMTGKSAGAIQHIAVENRVLTDFFRQQTNLVIIGIGKREEGYSLNRNNCKLELAL